MQTIKRWGRAAGLAALAVWGLSGCGGGNDPLPPKSSISKVYVMGDSLADAGTFGYKATIQDASNPKGFPLWTQLVANAFGVDGSAQCNFYSLNRDGTQRAAVNPACTNFAIGGGRVYTSPASSPLNVSVQMATKASLGNYTSSDLVLIDGGGNDAADLVGAYLGATTPAGLVAYQTLLAQQLDSATIAALLTQTNGAALAAGAYMQALADTFHGQIKAQVLDKGATHVAVLDMPDITLTPRFKAVLAGVAATTSASTAQTLQAAIRQWIVTYNTRLKSKFAGETRVAVVPFYDDFTDEINNPSAYQLSNATEAACPVTGVGSDGLPTYSFPTCTSAALDAAPPAGKAAGWWKSYAFSDGFHPTPYGHQLLASSVSRALARAGWL
jgi:phospholipase/lecithinase/hemolysin